MKIGVFDSGIGGEALANALQQTFPEAQIQVVNDHDNVPYGDKTSAEITELTDLAIQPLLTKGCDVIVIACNTATAVAIEILRQKYPSQHFIGIEPMVKTAAKQTKSDVIAVCATPATLASERYRGLVSKYASHLTVIEPDCSGWAYMIENNEINEQEIAKVINDVCERGADVIVLGCTHYHWIKELVQKLTNGNAIVLEPSEAIGRQVSELLGL
ncbi:aspartate/glutamate racemase family protein [Candidatus Saccharibacteria bacterium]|nr:aspartate/glutamate racemase family protein [Candidatus Saccharibacteria bacterium]